MPVLRAIPGPNQMTPVILLTSSATAIDSMRARPDYIVENNPNMTQHLKRIVGGLLSGTSGPAKAIASRPPRSLKKIVLVDDSPAIHHLLRSSFKRLPEIAIATLEDPTLAVEFVRKECPDLVLPDLNMPQLSGKEVMRDLKANADLQAIPVAFFTAADRADERAELLELGACHIFKKPFLPKSFADELVAAYHEF
jgi:CheY-like chemotaxis protein